jgi:hypothetical protein
MSIDDTMLNLAKEMSKARDSYRNDLLQLGMGFQEAQEVSDAAVEKYLSIGLYRNVE